MRLYPPYLGANVRIDRVSIDRRQFEVSMPLTVANRNFVGTHFGVSLYSMCYPFYMLILMENLGRDNVVWDKSASIRLHRPGRGRVYARFAVSRAEIEGIRARADADEKVEPVFSTTVVDHADKPIARVEKTLYIRRK
jgi:hypothetical protein